MVQEYLPEPIYPPHSDVVDGIATVHQRFIPLLVSATGIEQASVTSDEWANIQFQRPGIFVST